MHYPIARQARLLAALLLLLAPLTAHAEEPWPWFRGVRATGQAVEPLPGGDGPVGLELRWKRRLGSGYSGISVGGGLLVTAFADGGRDYVAAIDPDTGAERWRVDLAPTYRGHDGSHDGPISTPAIAGGSVFALGPSGVLVALDLATGDTRWRVDLVEDLGCEVPFYGFASSPTVAAGTVVLQIGGDEGSVAGFDPATGKLRWRSVEDTVMAQSPVTVELAGRPQVVVVGGGKVVGLDPASGQELWSMPHQSGFSPMGAFTSSALPLGDDRLYLELADDASMVVTVGRSESGLSALPGTESKGLGKSYSPPALWDGRLYGFTSRFLSALDPASGDLLWRSRDPGDGFLVAVDGRLAVLTKRGSLHLGDASPDGWLESARLQLFDDLAWTPPSYAGGALYLRSLGEIARVDLVRVRARSAAREEPVPSPLAPLAGDREAVDRFLEGRELPLVDGEEVIFLWRGEARDVAIAGDMIGMRREEPMRRLEGTDLWWWRTEIDRRARLNYLFFVDYEPTLDPAHSRRAPSTVLGPDMNWNRGEPMEMSWFAMPEWPGLRASETPAAGEGGRVESIELSVERPARPGEEGPVEVTVPARVWLPPGYDESDTRYPVIFVHNPHAAEAGGWPATLDRVVGHRVAPVVVVLLLESRPGSGAVFPAVVDQIDERYRTRDDRASRANVGMGFPSLAAISQTFRNAEEFGVVGIQSLYGLDANLMRVEDALGDTTAESMPLRIYFEWGRWDLDSPFEAMNMRATSRRVWDLLHQRGWRPLGGEVWDSTNWGSWRNRTEALLEALFPSDGQPEAFAAWTTGGV